MLDLSPVSFDTTKSGVFLYKRRGDGRYELSLKSKQWIRISLGTKETFGTLNSKNKLPKSREKNEEIIPRIFLKHPDDVAFRLWICNKYWPTFIGKYLNLKGRNFWKSFWKFSNETLFENLWKN